LLGLIPVPWPMRSVMFAQFIKLRHRTYTPTVVMDIHVFPGKREYHFIQGTSANRALLVPAGRLIAAAQAGLHDSGRRLVGQTTQAQAAWRTLLPSAHLRFRAQRRSSARLRAVVEELAAAGIVPHLAGPADTAALRGRKRHAKTDKTERVQEEDQLVGEQGALLISGRAEAMAAVRKHAQHDRAARGGGRLEAHPSARPPNAARPQHKATAATITRRKVRKVQHMEEGYTQLGTVLTDQRPKDSEGDGVIVVGRFKGDPRDGVQLSYDAGRRNLYLTPEAALRLAILLAAAAERDIDSR
jgi:hypothetical protein